MLSKLKKTIAFAIILSISTICQIQISSAGYKHFLLKTFGIKAIDSYLAANHLRLVCGENDCLKNQIFSEIIDVDEGLMFQQAKLLYINKNDKNKLNVLFDSIKIFPSSLNNFALLNKVAFKIQLHASSEFFLANLSGNRVRATAKNGYIEGIAEIGYSPQPYLKKIHLQFPSNTLEIWKPSIKKGEKPRYIIFEGLSIDIEQKRKNLYKITSRAPSICFRRGRQKKCDLGVAQSFNLNIPNFSTLSSTNKFDSSAYCYGVVSSANGRFNFLKRDLQITLSANNKNGSLRNCMKLAGNLIGTLTGEAQLFLAYPKLAFLICSIAKQKDNTISTEIVVENGQLVKTSKNSICDKFFIKTRPE